MRNFRSYGNCLFAKLSMSFHSLPIKFNKLNYIINKLFHNVHFKFKFLPAQKIAQAKNRKCKELYVSNNSTEF